MANRHEIQYVQFYVDGSAARKLDTVAPVKEKQQRTSAVRRPKRKNVYIDPVAILGIVVSVALFVSMLVGFHQLKTAQAEQAAMDLYVGQLKLSNHALQEQFHETVNLSDIEQKALALGMVPATEVRTTTIQISEPELTEEPASVWEQVGTFLASLFA